jgi:hypothetical protein
MCIRIDHGSFNTTAIGLNGYGRQYVPQNMKYLYSVAPQKIFFGPSCVLSVSMMISNKS